MGVSWYDPAPESSATNKAFAVCLTVVLLACLWVAFVVGQENRCERLLESGASEVTVARYCGPDHLGSRSWS